MTTLTFPPVPAAPVTVQRSSVTISDKEFMRLGIKTEAQRAVYRAIKSTALKHEGSVARAAGLDDITAVKALQDLVHLNLIRRGTAPLGGLGSFEIINRK